MVGCAQRPSELPVSNARHIETRVLNGTDKASMKAFITVLQDEHYTIESADLDLGLITASQNSEHALASLRKVEVPDSAKVMTPAQQFFLFAGLAIAVGAIIAIFSSDNDSSNDHHDGWRHHHDHYTIVGDHDNDGREYWEYRVTANFDALTDSTTQVRLSVQGTQRQGEAIEQAGPVQDIGFYHDLFQKVDQLLIN